MPTYFFAVDGRGPTADITQIDLEDPGTAERQARLALADFARDALTEARDGFAIEIQVTDEAQELVADYRLTFEAGRRPP